MVGINFRSFKEFLLHVYVSSAVKKKHLEANLGLVPLKAILLEDKLNFELSCQSQTPCASILAHANKDNYSASVSC